MFFVVSSYFDVLTQSDMFLMSCYCLRWVFDVRRLRCCSFLNRNGGPTKPVPRQGLPTFCSVPVVKYSTTVSSVFRSKQPSGSLCCLGVSFLALWLESFPLCCFIIWFSAARKSSTRSQSPKASSTSWLWRTNTPYCGALVLMKRLGSG